jgi:uncharacterized protein (TIGR03435 family)
MKSVGDHRNTICRLLVVAFAVTATPLAIYQVHAAQPQSPPQPTSPLTFDVASIKERDPKVPIGLVGMEVFPGRLVSRCASLKVLLFYAYRLTSSSPINGLPGWADTPCSDGIGTNTYEVQATMPLETTDAQARQMMQTLLGERFKLAVHWETKTRPVYALVIGTGGFKLKPSDPNDDPPRAPGSLGCPQDDRACHIRPLGSAERSDLTPFLSSFLGRHVVDRTGLTGTYYMDLKWAGDNSPGSSLPSLPTVLKEQLGLELKAETGSVEGLVIDRVEKPSPN